MGAFLETWGTTERSALAYPTEAADMRTPFRSQLLLQ